MDNSSVETGTLRLSHISEIYSTIDMISEIEQTLLLNKFVNFVTEIEFVVIEQVKKFEK